MSLAENIRRLRLSYGWNQDRLSKTAGLRVAHISELEKEKGDPKLSTLVKLKAAFDCSWDALLQDIGPDMTTDERLKLVFEAAYKLPDERKRSIIEVLDGYCIAAGFLQQFEQENKRPLGLHWYAERPKTLSEQPPNIEP